MQKSLNADRMNAERQWASVTRRSTLSSDAGVKYDGGKPELFQGVFNCFPRAIGQVGAVSAFGARKYDWLNWKLVPSGINRYSDAMVRHLTEECKGELYDDESGYLHAAHTAWNALCRLELILMEMEDNAQKGRGPEPGQTETPDTSDEPTCKGACQCGAKAKASRAKKAQKPEIPFIRWDWRLY